MPPPAADAPKPAPSVRRQLVTLFVVVLTDVIGFGLIIPLLPFYGRAFDASDFTITLLFSIYSLMQLIASPLLGLASDKLGRKPLLALAQVGSVGAYLILASATWFEQLSPGTALLLLFVARAIDGVTGASIVIGRAYVADITSADQRSRGMGLIGAAFGVGFAAGPALGGLLGDIDPALPAVAAAGFSALAAVMTLALLREPRDHEAAGAMALFDFAKLRRLLKHRRLMQVQAVWFVSMFAFVMTEAVTALFCKDVLGFGPREVGLFFAYLGVIIIAVQGGLIGPLTKRFGEWRLVIAGPLIMAGGMGVYLVIGNLAAAVWLLLVAGLLNAVGRSLQTATHSSLVSQLSPAEAQGASFGLFTTMGAASRVVGPAVAGALYLLGPTWPYALCLVLLVVSAAWLAAVAAPAHGSAGEGEAPAEPIGAADGA